jgi:hypothetical protein
LQRAAIDDDRRVAEGDPDTATRETAHMWYVGGGLLAILYIVLLITLGIVTIRKGHWVMFIVGIFIPIFWIIGAIMPPRTV